MKMNVVKQGEAVLREALELDEVCEVGLYNLAIIHQRFKNEPDEAEWLLRTLVSHHPRHAAGQLQLARVLVDKCGQARKKKNNHEEAGGYLEEAIGWYERSAKGQKDPEVTLIECLKAASQHGNNKQKVHAREAVSTIIRLSKIDLQPNTELEKQLESLRRV